LGALIGGAIYRTLFAERPSMRAEPIATSVESLRVAGD
jgi:hypothetical protein